jgi:hypothetical protein
MNQKPVLSSPFRAEMVSELKRIRRFYEADGTSAMGFDCIFSAINWRNIPNAPRGTNAVYFIRLEMRELLSMREFSGFLLE